MQSIARMKKECELVRKYGEDWIEDCEEFLDLDSVSINGIDYEVEEFGLDPSDFYNGSEKDILFCSFHVAQKLLQEQNVKND